MFFGGANGGRVLRKSDRSGVPACLMKFECNGKVWDTVNLLEFRTGDAVVTIYADPATRFVFVGILEPAIGVQIHRARASEILWLAKRYSLPELHDYGGGLS